MDTNNYYRENNSDDGNNFNNDNYYSGSNFHNDNYYGDRSVNNDNYYGGSNFNENYNFNNGYGFNEGYDRQIRYSRPRRRIRLSYVIIVVNILMWLFTEYYSKRYNADGNLIFGAKFNPLIMSGEYWRLVTPIFLHGGIVHLFFNSYSLYAIGPAVESLFGSVKFAVIYFIAGIMGNIASFAFSTHMSVGASGAIFGLLGALSYLIRKDRRIFKTSFGTSIVITIAYNLVYGFMNEGIDNYAHIGGLIGGFVAATVVGLAGERKPVLARVTAFALVIAMAFTGIYIGFNSEQNIELKNYYEEEVLPSKIINDALDSFNKKDYSRAEQISREVLDMKRISRNIKTAALDILASSLIIQGKSEEAIEYAQALVELDAARGHYLLALSYLNTNDVERAEKELEETLQLDPDNEHAAGLLEELRKTY
ncbi:MAG TPA: rhomboid family intramembrane serine protease [Clostridiaceae bacterium]|nr:rhomboid family intramembrane serine protease [Clostridiaceae bacterium]